jgi:hypothetical protein
VDPKKRIIIKIKTKSSKYTSGFGSHNNEQIDSKTFDIVNAGDQLFRRISRQIEPFAFIFG